LIFTVWCVSFEAFVSNFPIGARKVRSSSSVVEVHMARTYRPVALKEPKTKNKGVILVRDGAKGIVETIESWEVKGQIDEGMVEQWMDSGEAFWLTAEGTRAMHLAEQRDSKTVSISPPSTTKYAADFYRNVGGDSSGEEVFIPASLGVRKKDVDAGFSDVGDLESKGRAYRNVSQLMSDRVVLDRADDIAVRVRDEFPLASNTWSRWTNKTTQYGETSLTQVVSEYFKDYSIGDCGGDGVNYTPRPGYPGTLAPGTQFQENYPMDGLEKRILHPWPAMQAYQWHVRQPQAHPMIAPPLLWFALNEMYTDNFTASQLEGASDTIVGGSNMNPVDAIRIARHANLGKPYDPAVQIDHGGMIFTGGHEIPNYTPDHGPTYEDAAPPIPDRLKHVTERWFDPIKALAEGLENGLEPLQGPGDSATDEERQEAEEEEAVRRIAAQRLMESMYSQRMLEQQQRQEVSDAVAAALDADADAAAAAAAGEESGTNDHEEDILTAPDLSTREITRTLPTDVLRGRARSRRQLIHYTVNTIRDMQAEIIIAERDLATRKKSGRRKQRKTKKGADASLDKGGDSDNAMT
jgi:hypothetical protein